MVKDKDKVGRKNKLLGDPRIWHHCVRRELDKFIEGENEAKHTVFLICCGAFVKNRHPTSFNCLLDATSGAGKDHVVKNVLKLFPRQIWTHRTRISKLAINYWRTEEANPDWTWDGHILYLEDSSNAVLNSEAIKVMCSNGSKITVVKDQKAVTRTVNGKPVIIFTSANPKLADEGLRRIPIIKLNESRDQTRAIVKNIAKRQHARGQETYDPKITEALGLLEIEDVEIPYTNKLEKLFLQADIILRTNFERFMDFIKASTVLHQYQRLRDRYNWLIATAQDYDNARIALLTTISNPFMIPLSKKQERLLDIMQKAGVWKTVAQWCAFVSWWRDRQLYKELDKLHDLGFLEKQEADEWTSKKQPFEYRYKELPKLELPTADELQIRG